MPQWLLLVLVIPLAAVVLTSGFWVPLLLWLRQRRMDRRFQALAAELGATREGNELVVPAAGHGAVVRLNVPSKNSPWVLEVALPAREGDLARSRHGQAILLRPEGALDRFGKRLGVNREVQIGDDAFDRAVYVESDLPDEALRGLLGDAERRRVVLEILGAGFSEIRVHAGQSLISASRSRPGAVHMDAPVVREVARRLALLAPAIPPPEVPPDAVPGARGALRVVSLVLAVLGAAAVTLGAAPVMFAIRDAYPPLTTDLYWGAVPTAAVLFAGAVIVTALFVRGHSDSLRTLVALAIVILYALPCYTVGAFLGINGAFDGSATRHRSRVIERWSTTNKGTTSYRLRLAPLRRGDDVVETHVDAPTYGRFLAQGDAVTVVTGEGALGWEWIQRVEPARSR